MGQSDIPVAAPRDHIKAFERLGWTVQPKRGKGSHTILTKPGQLATLSIPAGNPSRRGTIAALIKAAGLTIDEYCAAFHDRRRH